MRRGKSAIGPAPRQRKAIARDRARGVRRAKKFVHQCVGCGWVPPIGLPSTRATMLHGHHVVPVAAGGDCSEHNVVVVCPNCHAVAHVIGEVVYAADPTGRESPRQRLVRWLRLANSNPAALAAELATHGLTVIPSTSPTSSPTGHA